MNSSVDYCIRQLSGCYFAKRSGVELIVDKRQNDCLPTEGHEIRIPSSQSGGLNMAVKMKSNVEMAVQDKLRTFRTTLQLSVTCANGV